MRCQMAGRPCERLATVVVPIPRVGDRHLCHVCLDSIRRMGMDHRVISLPEWRRRDLRKDFTGGAA